MCLTKRFSRFSSNEHTSKPHQRLRVRGLNETFQVYKESQKETKMFTNRTKKWQLSCLVAILLLALAGKWDTAHAQAGMQNVDAWAMAQTDTCLQWYV